jgi:hypothetical protein
VTQSTDLDFHLADVEFTVAVVDAVSRKGIPGATVLVRNLYAVEDEGGPADATRKAAERAISQAVSGDDAGLARLPPLHPGTLEIRASAAGYRRLAQPVRALFDGETDQRLEIPLERIGETLALRLRLPDSAPAAGASVLLMGSLTAASSLFEARADVEGVVSLPREHAGLLLVKHPRAGFLVREWRPAADEGSVEWSLPVLAERPLTVRVIDASGGAMAPRAELAVWVGGRRLSGASLAWLTGAPPTADANGYWIGRALPRGTVEVLAWTARARDLATTGALDAQATKVDFPWPETLEVRAFE